MFAAMNDSEKIEAIRLAKDGYTVKPLQFKNDHLYYDFDVWKKGNLPKGMGDIAVEVNTLKVVILQELMLIYLKQIHS